MYGDILLFPSGGTVYEWFVVKFTHGPYTHCAVDLGDGTDISAHPEGVTVEQTQANVQLVSVASQARPENLGAAMVWLKLQLGKSYGWLDVLSAALHAVGINLYLGQSDHLDCSDLVATYLDILEGKQVIPYHHLDIVSPNDLARRLGALK